MARFLRPVPGAWRALLHPRATLRRGSARADTPVRFDNSYATHAPPLSLAACGPKIKCRLRKHSCRKCIRRCPSNSIAGFPSFLPPASVDGTWGLTRPTAPRRRVASCARCRLHRAQAFRRSRRGNGQSPRTTSRTTETATSASQRLNALGLNALPSPNWGMAGAAGFPTIWITSIGEGVDRETLPHGSDAAGAPALRASLPPRGVDGASEPPPSHEDPPEPAATLRAGASRRGCARKYDIEGVRTQ